MKHTLLLPIAAGTAILSIAGALYFLQSDTGSDSRAALSGSPSAPSITVASASSAADARTQAELAKQAEARAPKAPPDIQAVDPAKYSTNPPKPDYEKEIIALANRLDIPDLEKAQALLARVHSLPPDGQLLAVEQAAQLIPDANYMQLRPVLFQLSTSDEMRETVLTDVLNRSDTVRMRTLVDLLRQPANSAQPEIREILVAYLDVDAGNDFARWEQAVEKFLRDNPEE